MAAPIVAGGVAVLASAIAVIKRRASRQYAEDDNQRHDEGQQAAGIITRRHRRNSAPRSGAGDGAPQTITDADNRRTAVAAGGPSFQSLQAASTGALVALYTPAGELIVSQQCGAPELQRWALATVRAPAQGDAPLGGEVRLPFFPSAALFSVVRKGTLIGFRSVGAGGRLLRAVRGRQLPGIGGHALGDGQSWWQEDASLLVLALRAEEVRVVSRADIRTTERLHAAQLRGVTFELARSQEQLQHLRKAADEATAAFQEHCCQASFQESQLVRQLKGSIAAETEARALADSACTLLQQQAQTVAEATAQREVQDHRTAQAAREATLRGLSEERNRLDAALSSIQMQLSQANASVSREAARLSPPAACAAAKAARLSPQPPRSADSGFNQHDDSGLESACSVATCYSDFSSDAEGWADGSTHSPAAGNMNGSAVDVPRKLNMNIAELDSSPEMVPHPKAVVPHPKAVVPHPKPAKLEDSFHDIGASLHPKNLSASLAALGSGTPEIREPGRLRRTWGLRRLTADGKPEADGIAEADGEAEAAGEAGAAAGSEAGQAPDAAASADTREEADIGGTGTQDGSSGDINNAASGGGASGDNSCGPNDDVPDIDQAAEEPGAQNDSQDDPAASPPCSDGSADENAAPAEAATPAAQRLRPIVVGGDDINSDVSDSEAADTVPPLRLLYSGRRRSLNFCRVAYHAPEQQGNAAGNENAASDKNDASDSHHSTADSGGGGGEIGGSEDSRRAGLVLNTKLDPEHVCKAGSEQRSPLRAFLRRHVQWGGR